MKRRCAKLLSLILSIMMVIVSVSFTTYAADISTTSTTFNLSIPDGIYFIKNKELSKYMQIDDGEEPTYSASGAFMELWGKDGNDYQKWNISSAGGGYYSIISVKSGLALSVQSGSLNSNNVKLVQETYTGATRQQWTFEKTSNGSYIIRPRSGESYSTDWCMAAGDGILTANGRNVEQRTYSNNTDYKDQWILERTKSQAIIIVPGITCSSLQNANGTKVWMYLGRQGQIACNEDGESINDIYPYNPDNAGILDMYKTIFNTLTTEYSDTYDVIFFAYDWRMTCANAAADLEALTDYYDNCILVAHSMGGIVASSYLARSSANRTKTDKLITVGTPYTGAPKALYVMETGKLNWITEAALNLSEYAKNIPALYELFPTEEYFDSYTRFIEVDGVAKNGYTAAWNYMKTLDWAKKSNGTVKPMFAEAEAFHNTLFINGTHVTDRSDVDTYKIIGVEEDTITCVAFDANNEYDFYYYSTEGDGTVPTYSALNNADKYSYKTYAYYKNHTDLIKYEGCIQLIIDIINEESYVYYDPSAEASLSTVTNMAEGLVTANTAPKDSDRITIVAKNINDMQIQNGDGSVVYSVGEELYYDDENGESHRTGSIWVLGDNSYQYVLYNDDYTITEVDVLGSDSSIRVDYCNYGLSENAVLYDNINAMDSIQIDELTVHVSVETGISIYRASNQVVE